MKAYVGLGSNLGDRLANLRAARERIDALPETRVVASAPVYETEPVGVAERYRDLLYLNTVLCAETELDLEEWSRSLHSIEDVLLRVRTGERNAPRTIDIDLLTYGDVISRRPHLNLPHPQCTARRFVCAPLNDLEPGLVLPGETRTVAEILASLPAVPSVRHFAMEW